MSTAEAWNHPKPGALREVQTATVLFADICGSTRLYQRLGDVAARSIVSAGMQLIMSAAEEAGGRLVKTLGDEVMCLFPNPDAAAEAAIDMQRRTAAHRHDGMPLEIHAGMQHGPVLLEGKDVFGDTVNAASYLCAVATAGQVLMGEATLGAVSDHWRASVRPLFFAVMKGGVAESAVYQLLWQEDRSTLTDVNVRRHNLAPPDTGGVLLIHRDTEIRLDPRRPEVLIGRGEECDIRVDEPYASRRHALVVLRRTQVHLVDQSTNGTFVRRATGEHAHVFRTELLLDGAGQLSMGRAFDQPDIELVEFRRDRRALFRP